MAEEHDQEKTLPATPRRLEQAREEGQVVRSREFTSAALMVSAAAGALWGGQAMSGLFSSPLARGLNIDRKAAFDMPVALDRAGVLAMDALVILLPALGLLAAVAMFAPLALGGWLFTTKPLVPNFGRMSPGRWIGQLFSFHGAAELVKSIAKATVITLAALVVLWNSRVDIALLLSGSAAEAIPHAARLTGWGFLAAAAAMLLIAAIDVPSQLWQHHPSLCGHCAR